jgi:hypothetical protein
MTNIGPSQTRYMLFENVITYNGMTASNPPGVSGGTTGINNGATGTILTFGSTGTYNIQLSAQVYKNSGGTDIVDIWPIKGNTAIPWSNSQVTITGNNRGLFYANSSNTYNFNKDDKLQIGWQSADAVLYMNATGATGNVPGTPSVKLNVTKISN